MLPGQVGAKGLSKCCYLGQVSSGIGHPGKALLQSIFSLESVQHRM